MFFRRFFKTSYKKAQSQTSGVLREFYEEAVWFLHQPSSLHFRLVACMALLYWFSVQVLAYQEYYASVYRRKKMRLLELRNSNCHQMTREEYDLLF